MLKPVSFPAMSPHKCSSNSSSCTCGWQDIQMTSGSASNSCYIERSWICKWGAYTGGHPNCQHWIWHLTCYTKTIPCFNLSPEWFACLKILWVRFVTSAAALDQLAPQVAQNGMFIGQTRVETCWNNCALMIHAIDILAGSYKCEWG
jgi:hypothetical protein